jgi:hypothetical protein
MRKALILLSLTFSLMGYIGESYGQTACLPINSDKGQVEFKGRVTMGELPMNDVYSRILSWGITKAVSGKEVLKDREAGILKFQVQVNYRYKETFRAAYYSISLMASDGYFEYTVNGFMMNEKPMETYLTGKSDDIVYITAFNDICEKLTVNINDLKHLKPEE